MADEFAAAPVEFRSPEAGGTTRPAEGRPMNCAVYGLWFGREVLGLDSVLPLRGDGEAIKAVGFAPEDMARAAGGNWRRGGFGSLDEVAATVRDSGGTVLALVEYEGLLNRTVGAHQLTFYRPADRPDVVMVREWTGTHALEYEHVWGGQSADVAGVYGIVFDAHGRPVDPLTPGESPTGRAGVEHSYTRAGHRPFESADRSELVVGAAGRPGAAPMEGERVREASVARDWVVEQLRQRGWHDEGTLADIRVVTSELVANSLRHSSGAVHVVVTVGERDGGRVAYVQVIDNSPVLVAPVASGELPDDLIDALDPEDLDALIQGLGERGRGMGMVADLTDDSGVEELPDGKSTWFELAEPSPPATPAAERAPEPDDSTAGPRRSADTEQGAAPDPAPGTPDVLAQGDPARIADWLRTTYGVEVEGFDDPGVHPRVAGEFAAAVHDILSRYRHIDLPLIRIADLDHPSTIAELRADPSGRVRWLGLNKSFAGDPATLRTLLTEAQASGRIAPGHAERPVYSRIVHELGHALDYAGGGRAREQAMAALREHYRANHPGRPGGFDAWLRGLAGYSFKGENGAFVVHEALAEAFADREVPGVVAAEPALVLHRLLAVHAEAAAERARRASRGDGTTEYRYPAQSARSHLEGGVPKNCAPEALRFAREELGIEAIAPRMDGAGDIAARGVSAGELSAAAGGGWHPGGFRSLDEVARTVRETGGVVLGVVEFLGLNRPDVVGAHAFVMFRAPGGAVIVREELAGTREFVYSWGESPPRVAGVYGIVYDADGVPERPPAAGDRSASAEDGDAADRPTSRIGAGPQDRAQDEGPGADRAAAEGGRPAQAARFERLRLGIRDALIAAEKVSRTGPEGRALTEATPTEVREALASLSTDKRRVLVLRFWEGRSLEATAAVVHRPVEMVRAIQRGAVRDVSRFLVDRRGANLTPNEATVTAALSVDPARVHRLIERLPAAAAEYARLRLVSRLSAPEIAAAMGRTPAQVSTLKSRAFRALAELLTAEAGSAPRAAGSGPAAAASARPVDRARDALRERPEQTRQAMDALTADQRQVLESTLLRELPLDRVAARMGRSEGAVGALQRRAARRLLELLDSGTGSRPEGKAPATTASGTPALEAVRRAREQDPQAFAAALARLPRAQREVVEHRFVAGRSAADTGEAMGRTEYAVRRLQQRAVHALAEILTGAAPPRRQGGAALELVRRTHTDNPAALRAARRGLPPDQARVVRHRVLRERSIASTAAAMKRTEDSVNALFRTAIRRLADILTGARRLDPAHATAYVRAARRDHPGVLDAAVARLPEPERTFAVLRFVREKKMISIESALGYRRARLEALRDRTLDRLIELLTPRLGPPPPPAAPATARGELADRLRAALREQPVAAHRAIARLPAIERLILDLRFLRHKTLEETAAELGRSGDAVSAVQRRALSRIPDLLAEELARPVPEPSPVDSGAPAQHRIEWIETMRRDDPEALLRAIALLSPEQRRLARHRFLHGAAVEDIAAAEARPRAWVQDLQRRTVRTLRELLADELPAGQSADTAAASARPAGHEPDGAVVFAGDLPEGGTPLYRGVPRLLTDGSPNPAYAQARAGRAVPRGTRSVSAEEHVLGAHEESDLTSWSRSRAMAEAFARGDGIVLEWRTGAPPEGAGWEFVPFLDYDLMMQYEQVLIRGTLTGARAVRHLAGDAAAAADEHGWDESRAGETGNVPADWDLSGYRTAAEVGAALSAAHGITVTGFDLPGVDVETAREYARAVHDALRDFPWIDVREVRIGEIDQDPPPADESQVQPAVTHLEAEDGHWFARAVVFNVRYATRPDLFATLWAEAIAAGHMAGTADRPVYGVITHELGHAVDAAGHFGAREEYFYELFHRFRILRRSTDLAAFSEWAAEQLSAYSLYTDGTIDPVEALPESFAAVRQSRARATEAQRALHDLLIDRAEAVARDRAGSPSAGHDPAASGPAATAGSRETVEQPLSIWDPAGYDSAAEVGAALARRHPRLTVLGFDTPGVGVAVALEYARALDELLSAFPLVPLRQARIAPLDDELYARADYVMGAGGARTAGITLNTTCAVDPRRFAELWAAEVAAGRRAGPGDRAVYANVVHEFGHVLDAFAGHRTRGRAEEELFRRYAAAAEQVTAEGFLDWLRAGFGDYSFDRQGGFAAGEAVAEAFAAVRDRGRGASEGQRALHRLLLGEVDAAARAGEASVEPVRGADESRRGVPPDPVRLPAPRPMIADWEDTGLHEFRSARDAEAGRKITEQGGRVLGPGIGIVDGPSPRVIVTEWLGSDIDATLTDALDAHPELAEALTRPEGAVEYLSATVTSAGEVVVQSIEPPRIERVVLGAGPWAGTAMTYWEDRDGYWRPVPRDVPPDRIPAASTSPGPPATREMGESYRGEDSPERSLLHRVHYLTPEEREAARVFIGPDGRLYRAVDGTPFHSYRTGEGRRTEFVMDGHGNLYADRSRIGRRMMHSSFLAGAAVAAAGMIEVHAGRVLFLDNRSGHYRPGMPEIVAALRWLTGRGLGLAHGFELRDHTGAPWRFEAAEAESADLAAESPAEPADRAAGFAAAHAVRVSGFDALGLNPDITAEYLDAVRSVLAAHPWLALEQVRIAPLPPGIIARAELPDSREGRPSIVLNEQYAVDVDLLTAEWENSESGAAIVGPPDRPVFGAVTYEMGRILDHAGGHSARRLAMRALYAHYAARTAAPDLPGFNRWIKARFSFDSFGGHGSFAVDRALAESFAAVANDPEAASDGHRLLAALLSRRSDPAAPAADPAGEALPADAVFGGDGIEDRWTRHATAAEVAATLREEYALTVTGFDLPGVDVRTAREIARAVTELLDEHPAVDLRGLAVDELERAVFGRTSMVREGAGWFTRSIVLNERYVTDPLLFQHDWAVAAETGFVRGPRDRPVYAVLVHEFGHALDAAGGFAARTKASLALALRFHELGGTAERLADWLSEVLTRYSLARDGTLEPAEALPEAFAAVRHDPVAATPEQHLLADLLLRAMREAAESGREGREAGRPGAGTRPRGRARGRSRARGPRRPGGHAGRARIRSPPPPPNRAGTA
ncbi:sigma factor-like helix-turn-helix DNA-binding protein, partial [Nocardia farcinica]|uniref:sigma factor-like helix-turn-helix DNA-binding protein n=1 Tax=Nocardia farcinica TaxID=37329 RepID=UPI002456C50D